MSKAEGMRVDSEGKISIFAWEEREGLMPVIMREWITRNQAQLKTHYQYVDYGSAAERDAWLTHQMIYEGYPMAQGDMEVFEYEQSQRPKWQVNTYIADTEQAKAECQAIWQAQFGGLNRQHSRYNKGIEALLNYGYSAEALRSVPMKSLDDYKQPTTDACPDVKSNSEWMTKEEIEQYESSTNDQLLTAGKLAEALTPDEDINSRLRRNIRTVIWDEYPHYTYKLEIDEYKSNYAPYYTAIKLYSRDTVNRDEIIARVRQLEQPILAKYDFYIGESYEWTSGDDTIRTKITGSYVNLGEGEVWFWVEHENLTSPDKHIPFVDHENAERCSIRRYDEYMNKKRRNNG